MCWAWGTAAVLPFLLLTTARAQTISPVIVEYREKARGSFELRNDSLFPLNVVLEPHSFTVDRGGEPKYYPLEPGIHLRLSTMSFRLPPRQTYRVFYEAAADRLPAWFTIYATITSTTPATSMKIALQLPHTVYLLTKKLLAREAVVFVREDYLGAKHQIEVEIENRADEMDRVQEVEVTSARSKKTYGGFPLFPRQSRTLRLDWDQPDGPERITLKFARFRVEHPIHGQAPSR